MTREESVRKAEKESSRRIIRKHIAEMQAMICRGASREMELSRSILTVDDCKLMGEFASVCSQLEQIADQIYGPYIAEKDEEA